MAYLDSTGATSRERLTAIGTTGLINLSIGALLVFGLATKFTPPPPPMPNPTGTIIDVKPTPPQPDDVKPKEDEQDPISKITRPENPFEFEIDEGPQTPPSQPVEGTTPEPTGTAEGQPPKPPAPPRATPSEPPPPPLPAFTPQPPVPIGNPGKWVTARDYPTSELRRQSEGTTRFVLSVNERGRPTDCQITQSSGYKRLDRTACSKVKRRARFEPATDETGSITAGRYRGAVRWQIPE